MRQLFLLQSDECRLVELAFSGADKEKCGYSSRAAEK